ncbi:molybdate ABC transporter substrate-binding protein [Hahella ganghwensis]|uniref:molybdate ABC transporter substrate-binding protein n=1 Tax=Hahella ganghwensis TaxID=286420 RepID=UPI00039CA826|nr:molybdate ABC transporter substrate-binding protein [Hahella ganghwensis]
MRRIVLCFIGMFLVAATSRADEATIAVASNFTAAMQELTKQFESESGHKLQLAFGSSGKFFAQISHGAPFHAFFSADQTKPEKLERSNLVVPGSRFTYATGALALWSTRLPIEQGGTILKEGNYRKLALANPKLAPYGAAAVEVLTNLGINQVTRAKWVQGENISQTYQFVGSGNADLGFVALSQILSRGQLKGGSSWVVPEELYAPIHQDAVILAKGKGNAAVIDFFRFLKTEQARSIIASYGYKTK